MIQSSSRVLQAILLLVIAAALLAAVLVGRSASAGRTSVVDADEKISVPRDYRT